MPSPSSCRCWYCAVHAAAAAAFSPRRCWRRDRGGGGATYVRAKKEKQDRHEQASKCKRREDGVDVCSRMMDARAALLPVFASFRTDPDKPKTKARDVGIHKLCRPVAALARWTTGFRFCGSKERGSSDDKARRFGKVLSCLLSRGSGTLSRGSKFESVSTDPGTGGASAGLPRTVSYDFPMLPTCRPTSSVVWTPQTKFI